MTTSRLALLLAVMLGGMSLIFFLPQSHDTQPVGIRLDLPEALGEWWGKDVAITQKEIDVLGKETSFARKSYENVRNDQILTSIVLAGTDMMTSIHRPERCLAAQGWEFAPGGERLIEVPGHGKLPITRLRTHRMAKGADGQPMRIDSICDYWFAGYTDLTASHGTRVWLDSRDRILHGYVQRWAMILTSADITAGRTKFGRDEAQTDQMLEEFISKLAPIIHTDSIKYH
jgi:EpsI family protein